MYRIFPKVDVLELQGVVCGLQFRDLLDKAFSLYLQVYVLILEFPVLLLEVLGVGLASLALWLVFDGMKLVLDAAWMSIAYSSLQREVLKQPAAAAEFLWFSRHGYRLLTSAYCG